METKEYSVFKKFRKRLRYYRKFGSGKRCSHKLLFKHAGFSSYLAMLKSSLLGREVQLTMREERLMHHFNIRIPSGDMFVYHQIYSNNEYDFDVLSPPAVIVDVGANIGLTSMLFASRFPNAKIIAIEACETKLQTTKA